MIAKKNISLQEAVTHYIPPRLVRAQQGWYIVYYHQFAGQWLRERKTFNLNRIKSLKKRLDRAREIIAQIDTAMRADRAGENHSDFSALGQTPIADAVLLATNIVCQSPKKETRRSFRMIHKMLLGFIETRKMSAMPVESFTVRHAREFLDAATSRGVSNTTYNNYRGFAVTLFNKLVEREYIHSNPFERIPMLRREDKKRRPFTDSEKSMVLDEVKKRDYWLFVLILFHRFTLLRRTECYRLRFSDVNLKDGYVHLPKSATKNGKVGIVTIPDVFRDFLISTGFLSHSSNYLIFGQSGKPHPSIPAGENLYKVRHRQVLLSLHKAGKLPDITGLSLYSWKDTGMTELAKVLRPIELRDQARHASVEQSLVYYHADKVIDGVKSAAFEL